MRINSRFRRYGKQFCTCQNGTNIWSWIIFFHALPTSSSLCRYLFLSLSLCVSFRLLNFKTPGNFESNHTIIVFFNVSLTVVCDMHRRNIITIHHSAASFQMTFFKNDSLFLSYPSHFLFLPLSLSPCPCPLLLLCCFIALH